MNDDIEISKRSEKHQNWLLDKVEYNNAINCANGTLHDYYLNVYKGETYRTYISKRKRELKQEKLAKKSKNKSSKRNSSSSSYYKHKRDWFEGIEYAVYIGIVVAILAVIPYVVLILKGIIMVPVGNDLYMNFAYCEDFSDRIIVFVLGVLTGAAMAVATGIGAIIVAGFFVFLKNMYSFTN